MINYLRIPLYVFKFNLISSVVLTIVKELTCMAWNKSFKNQIE